MYIFGVVKESIPRLDLKNRGMDVEIKVGSAECNIVGEAIDNGNVQVGNDRSVAIIDRGG